MVFAHIRFSTISREIRLLKMENKNILIVVIGILIVLILVAVLNVNSKSTGYSITENDIENLHEVSFDIEGMYCDSCAYAVKAQMEELDGVVVANINAIEASGIVKYDADIVDLQTIGLASTVYPATVVEDRKI